MIPSLFLILIKLETNAHEVKAFLTILTLLKAISGTTENFDLLYLIEGPFLKNLKKFIIFIFITNFFN